MGPVRIGNLAYHQTQNDVFGEAILASTQAFFDTRLERPAGKHMFRDLERLGEQAVLNYKAADAGMWELRSATHPSTSEATSTQLPSALL